MQIAVAILTFAQQVLQKALSRQLEESFISLTSAAKDGDADLVSYLIHSRGIRGRKERLKNETWRQFLNFV